MPATSAKCSSPSAPRPRARIGGLAALALVGLAAARGEPTPPGGANLDTLRVTPARVALRGPDSVQQLAVEAIAAGVEVKDLTAEAQYTSSDPKVATVAPSG